MEGRAPDNLLFKMVTAVRSGGRVLIVGWPQHVHNEHSRMLERQKMVTYTEKAPSFVGRDDFVIFTNLVGDAAVRKVRSQTQNLDPRLLVTAKIREYLLALEDAITAPEGTPLPATNGAAAHATSEPPAPNTVGNDPPAQPTEAHQELAAPQPTHEPPRPPVSTPTPTPPLQVAQAPAMQTAEQKARDLVAMAPEIERELNSMEDRKRVLQAELDGMGPRKTDLEAQLARIRKAREVLQALDALF